MLFSAYFVNGNAIFVWSFRGNQFVEISHTHPFDAYKNDVRKHNSHVSTVHSISLFIRLAGWLAAAVFAFIHAFVAV